MSNNRIILNGCIEQFRTDNELATNSAETFELFSLSQITKSMDLAFEDIKESIVDGGNDGGIDSIIVIIDDYIPASIEDCEDIKFSRKSQLTIFITQCKKESSFKESTLDKLITTLPELFNLEKSVDALLVRFNSDLVAKSSLAREIWKKCSYSGGTVRVLFNYCCYAEKVETNGAFISKESQLKEAAEKIFVSPDIGYSNYSCEELLKLYQTHKNQRLSVKFKEAPLSTSYENYGIGYVGTVKLADYKTFITDTDNSIRDDLFESNIRHFQGLVDVNKKIKESIEQPNKEDFWWLNNGITVIANQPSLVGTTLSIDSVQIVNGLQTSYSIFNNHDGSIEDTRSVLVKVIINEDKETIDHIIASTNSQNPVNPALLRATDEVQRDIELYFINEGYFYDRRKNYYKNQGKPVSKIFGIQYTAQAIESIAFGNPYSARSKPTSLIKEDVTYKRIFNPSSDFKAFLNCCLILKKSNELWGDIDDIKTKIKLSNFKLHLARIAASFILNKSTYSLPEVGNIAMDHFTQQMFDDSVQLLSETIDDYNLKNDQATNLINMAKAKGLTDEIMIKLNKKFSF